jgi:hypothetical protein
MTNRFEGRRIAVIGLAICERLGEESAFRRGAELLVDGGFALR